MTSEPARPALTDAAGSGGINAQDGFDYQAWDGIVRIPGWLRQQNFEGVLFEGLEDFEARFFAPQTPRGHVLDRFQAKSGVLQTTDLRGVFESFARFATANPDVARVQTLVTPALPVRLHWLGRDPDRVRRARPFYRPFPGVLEASDGKLRGDLVDVFGEALGDFVADSVAIDLRPVSRRDGAQAAFGGALHDAFPELDLTQRQTVAVFDALSQLAGASRGTMLTSARLIDVVQTASGKELADSNILRLRVRSDNIQPESEGVEIDASAFSGTNGTYPDTARWKMELLDPLAATAAWARRHGRTRVRLSGSYRISTALALGWSFRAASGFELEIPTRDGAWPTDVRPNGGDAARDWEVRLPSGQVNRLAVAIGVLRDPSPEVQGNVGVPVAEMMAAFLPTSIRNGDEAQLSVETVKANVLAALRTTGASTIDLFLAGPAAFATALGHRWNALPPTQLFEFLPSERRYVRTALLLDRVMA